MNRVLLLSVLLSTTVFAETVPTKQAKKNGFTTCAPLVEQLSDFLVKKNNHGSVATWNSKSSDKRQFNTIVPIQYSDGNSVSTISVSQSKNGQCDGNYTSIFYLDSSCSVERETTFKEWKYKAELAGLIVLTNPSGGVDKVLLPAGSGCVSISRETVYQ